MDTLNYPIDFDNLDMLQQINNVSDLVIINGNFWNYNEPFKIIIETDSYGDNVEFLDTSKIIEIDKYITDLNYSFYEIINDVDYSTETNNSYSEGTKEIEVKDASEFLINDIIKIKNYLYRIININENLLTLDKQLKEDIDSSENVELQGNTGKYILEINDKIDYQLNKYLTFNINLSIENNLINKSLKIYYTNRYFNTPFIGAI